jgi:hypothetical protein
MLQALWWLCRAGSAWCLSPRAYPPRQTVGSRLDRWVRQGVLDRALALLDGCLVHRAAMHCPWPQATSLRRHSRHAKRQDR